MNQMSNQYGMQQNHPGPQYNPPQRMSGGMMNNGMNMGMMNSMGPSKMGVQVSPKF